jgi:hypothetical protein
MSILNLYFNASGRKNKNHLVVGILQYNGDEVIGDDNLINHVRNSMRIYLGSHIRHS